MFFKSISKQIFDGIRSEVMKDRNKNGIPDALEYIDKLEAGVNVIGEIAETLDRSDVKKLLKAGNMVLGNKVKAESIDRWSNHIAAIGPAADALEALLQKAEESLKEEDKD